jgi:hypothetical protein
MPLIVAVEAGFLMIDVIKHTYISKENDNPENISTPARLLQEMYGPYFLHDFNQFSIDWTLIEPYFIL